MLSRHADSVYWIGRYIERAEATARMVDVHYHFGLESPVIGHQLRWSSIIAISGSEEDYYKRYPTDEEKSVLEFFVFDHENPNSILSSVTSARENARSIRDQISSEMWESLNAFYLELRTWNVPKIQTATPHSFFAWVKNSSHLFQGICNRTLLIEESREFLDVGRFLERADQTARILDVKYHDLLPRYSDEHLFDPEEFISTPLVEFVTTPAGVVPADPRDVGGPVDIHGWTAVLKSVGAFEAFQKTHRQGVSPGRVVEFLLLDQRLPASVRHCISRVESGLRRISKNTDRSPKNPAERVLGKLYNDLNFTTAEEIIAEGLHEYLESVQERCGDVGSAIYETYLRV